MQTTNGDRGLRRGRDALVDIPLAFHLFPADAMRFIPVELRLAGRPASQPDQSNSLEFTPTPPTVEPAQALGFLILGPTAMVWTWPISPTILNGIPAHDARCNP